MKVPASLFSCVLALTLAACFGEARSSAAGTVGLRSSHASGDSGTAPGSSPSASVGPLEVIPVDTLLAERSARDGQIVGVDGDVLAGEGFAQLCLFLDVAPEVHCDPHIVLTGLIPAETLASLEFFSARNLWYGYVTVVGRFHASGADGRPTVEIHQIQVPQGAFPGHLDARA